MAIGLYTGTATDRVWFVRLSERKRRVLTPCRAAYTHASAYTHCRAFASIIALPRRFHDDPEDPISQLRKVSFNDHIDTVDVESDAEAELAQKSMLATYDKPTQTERDRVSAMCLPMDLFVGRTRPR